MIQKKPSIQYIWEFPLTIKINTINQSGRITFWSKGRNLLYKRKIALKDMLVKAKLKSGGGGGGGDRGAGAQENRGQEGYGRREMKGREAGVLRGREAGEQYKTVIYLLQGVMR